jgi:hypothetical protein
MQGVTTYPVTVLKDGFGRARPAQVGACGFHEMRDALLSAHQAGTREFVVVSHNFEMLRSGSSTPDWIVVKRFERLCAFLAQHSEKFNVRGFGADLRFTPGSQLAAEEPRSTWVSTIRRHVEQALRRLHL